MALSTELLRRLNLEDEPLPKRLKLAENVFYTVDIPIARKEDLIYQWFCNACCVEKDAWSSLKNCLKYRHIDAKITVKKLLINRLTEQFEGDIRDLCEDVFECCKLLVGNSGMQQYFVNNPEDLGCLMMSLLNCVHKIYICTFHVKEETFNGIELLLINKNNGLMLIAYNTTIIVLEYILQIFKCTFTTKAKFRSTFIRNILYPLCAIIDHKSTCNTNRLGAVAHKSIQQIIFGKKHGQIGAQLKDENATIIADLLSTFTDNIKTKDLHTNLTTFVFIFRAAIGIFKSDSSTLDLIMRELVECAGIFKKQILNSFLKLLSDISLDFDNRVHGVTLFNYYQNIINDIVLSDNMEPIECELLIQLASLNPLIIEKKISDILRKVFTEKPMVEYTNLMIAILNVSMSLRQEEKLISALLISLKLSLNEIQSSNVDMFFPNEFRAKLMNSVNNITNSQGVNILRTLIYHLNNNCMEVLQSNDACKGTNILMVQGTVVLLVTLLEGVCVYEYTGTLTTHRKFINTFYELGNVLSQLLDKLLHLNHSEKAIVLLLTAIFSWNETQKALRYYVPKAVLHDLKSPVSEDQWQKLIEEITHFDNISCKNSMNALILQRMKMLQNKLNKSCIKVKNLIGGLEYYWSSILKVEPHLLLTLNNKDMSKVTHFLVIDMSSNTDNFSAWVDVLHNDSLQENKRFIVSLLSCIIKQIGCLLKEGTTKSLSEYFTTISLFEMENTENEEINKVMMCIKEKLLKDEWIPIEDTCLCKIKVYLEVLLHIPLMFLCANVRFITFTFILALKKECDQSDEIISLCNTLFSDLLEKSGIDLLQYVDPSLLLKQLPQSTMIQKTLEQSFKNDISYSVLKKLVKASTCSQKDMYFLLESIQRSKSKLNTDQKAIVRKAENKLKKALIKTLPVTIAEAKDMEILNLILKTSMINEKFNETLKNVVESTLHNIFMKKIDNNDISTNALLQHGIQLAVIILRNRKVFCVTKQITNRMFDVMLQHACIDLLLPLLELSEPKEFMGYLKQVHDETVKILLQMPNNNHLENICVIWDTILKINMSSDRNKFRLIAINKLLGLIQMVNVSENLWSNLLKLLQNILTAKYIYLPTNIIDTSISLALKSLQAPVILTCKDVLGLCNILLRTKASLMTDRLPALLILYRRMLNIIVYKSKDISNKLEEEILKCLTLDMEKFTSSLIKLKKDIIRLTPYLIADLLELSLEASTAAFVKTCIQNCTNQLISICDQHGIAFLSRTLPISMQEIFKSQLDTYKRFYKFSGKI